MLPKVFCANKLFSIADCTFDTLYELHADRL